jgi:hypothetical protein
VVPRRLAGASVDDELLGTLGDVGVEVVEQHPERRLRLPGARMELSPARRADRREIAAELLHELLDGGHAHGPFTGL